MMFEIDPVAPTWLAFGAEALRSAHIVGGAVGMLAGTAALLLPKGGRSHRLAGQVFLVAMLIMAGIGAGVAPFLPERASVLGALVTLYLVATAWLTVRRPPRRAGRLEVVALAASIGLLALTATFGWMAASDPTGTLDGQPWQAFVLFGVITPLAVAGDFRLLRRGGLAGRPRIARHLWRMCMALFIAVGSYFLGQPDFLPGLIRGTGWVYVPPLATLLAMGYGLVRIASASTLPPGSLKNTIHSSVPGSPKMP